MRYHCIINAYSEDINRQLEEFCAFKRAFLSESEEGEAFILCRDMSDAEKLNGHVSKNAAAVTAGEYCPETVLAALHGEILPEDLYIFGSGYSGTELAVRLAERAGGSSVTAVHSLEKKERLTVRKMVYANHMEGAFCMRRGPYCISLAKGMDRQQPEKKEFCDFREIQCPQKSGFVVSRETCAEETSGGLGDANIVIAAGRGVRNKENAEFLQKSAEALGGELGVSRPAAMNAWAPMNRLIGVSGAMLKPDICIAAGVSGAAAFYAGIEKSKFIVAINTDEQAPIMKKADVAVADDFVPVMKALRKLAEK